MTLCRGWPCLYVWRCRDVLLGNSRERRREWPCGRSPAAIEPAFEGRVHAADAGAVREDALARLVWYGPRRHIAADRHADSHGQE